VAEIAAGTAPDDLATKILTARDPETGERLSAEEMVDQVAIFFLAGHETSASALSWTLYLLARYPEWQERVAAEVAGLPEAPGPGDIARLTLTRDVFREALRLYPPVPMMVREAARAERFATGVPWARRSSCRPGICTGTRGFGTTPTGSIRGAGGRRMAGPVSAAGLHPVFRRGAGLSRGGVRDDGGAASAGAALLRFRFDTVAGRSRCRWRS
jgi:hypothetical protein